MTDRFRILLIGCGLLIPVANGSAEQPQTETASAEDIEFFEKTIRPLLAKHCYECHSQNSDPVFAGLKLDTAHDVFAGGDGGKIVTPGKPEESSLIEVISYAPGSEIQMPPEGKMPDQAIAAFTEWVRRGVPFPKDSTPVRPANEEIDFAAAKKFWSFQPVKTHPLPSVAAPDWPRQRIDHFVLAAMEREGLEPSPMANRATLLRRLTFDLTGLPPTPAEVDEFVNDPDPKAYEKQVNRLLDSPHFGERWGRVWLDMARYTDRTASWLDSTGDAYRYRDWVVQAMNDDVPYDEFVHRQLATDLMPTTGPEDMPALGFLGLSPNYWKELQLPSEIIKVIVADEWEERVDAVSRTFLGLTVACARCHDHKFDPITTKDYYALAGVFASCRFGERPLIDEKLFAPVREARKQVKSLETQLAKLKKQKPQPTEKIEELTKKIADLKATPHFDTPTTPGVVEESLYVERKGERPDSGSKLTYKPTPRDLHVFIRGNPNRLGELVPRRFLTVLSDETSQPFQTGSGRLDLARAITNDAQPLAARVIVNRMWHQHFGNGIVATPSNFGQSGDRPTHPELLDDLTARFIENGWSLKWLHREIVLSATYRQSSRSDRPQDELDPGNRWLSRMNRKRLEVEAWRDAMFAACGDLDLTIGGPSVALTDAKNDRRTIYTTIHRRDMSTTLLMHDFPDPTSHSPRRQTTTTPLQGLYTLNGPLLLDRAKTLATRLATDQPDDFTERIRLAYRLLYARDPSPEEIEIGLAFLTDSPNDAAWTQYAHVLLASNEFLFVN
ncbi:PSD1 and planctomycete cytochrome C domain-containing protein [Thalassoroseus pseudoceratinae]|uniref:PSD1 and planctomycete cytochrome C domain-containing protein n=1 Tax=Thalassoroseus pseudoceratinae TaxID=2713176 RepID=UPI0014225A3A|nr:PSD1 and planctomycete cytochrome C domain-containing protein [Thalassoroseus pseudoceratinae]